MCALLRHRGMVDMIDDSLVLDGAELDDQLLLSMPVGDQPKAVFSRQAKDSLWVPWEIGGGSEKSFRNASFSLT